MSWLLGFIVGVVVGVIGAWWFFERRDAASRGAMEAGWKKKLEHVEAEVRRADAAHEETKERLRQLQQASLPPPAAAAAAPPSGKPAGAAPAAAPALGPEEVERIAQARRKIDAKLAQLPAGSSARQRLLAERATLAANTPPAAPASAPVRRLFEPPPGPADELERIRGIGPVLKQRLNELGITTFGQIAALSEEDLAHIDEVLDFKGRIGREGWVEQAKALQEAG